MWEVKDKKPVQSKRQMGREAKAGVWLARHPGAVLVPGLAAFGAAEIGVAGVAGVGGGVVAGLGAWYRWHPNSFDRFAAMRLRSWRRRWLARAYRGGNWQDTMLMCGLIVEDRRSGEVKIPRVLKVRAFTPTVETVYIKIYKGQSLRQFIDAVPELTEALQAERVSIMRVRPLVLALVVQRRESFTSVIPAPAMAQDAEAVDLSNVYLGETEYGADWTAPMTGAHWLTAGATGSGKGSFTWGALRAMAPAIRDGIVRPWVCDPKQVELAQAADVFYRYAGDEASSAEVIAEFLEDQQDTQKRLADAGLRKAMPSREFPLNILIIDELAAVVAYGDPKTSMKNRRALALIGSQGRATGHLMHGSVQEPTKDVVNVRDLFTHRLCLRLTSEHHVNGTLGEGARERGGLADEIPNTPETAGIGYVMQQRSRTPMRVRLAYTSDADIKEFVDFIGRPSSHLRLAS